MFGGPLKHPGKPKPRVKPFTQDILLPGIDFSYGHVAREPNTDYHIRLLHYKQRQREMESKGSAVEDIAKEKEGIKDQWIRHTDKRYWQHQIKQRLAEKMKKFDEEVEVRRERLAKLLFEEERQYYYEATDQAQRGGDTRLDEMKIRVKELKAKKEEEREAFVKQKRIQQYMDRCLDLRGALTKRNAQEVKASQLQQMRENESRREADRELERFWYELMLKDIEARRERDVQDSLERQLRDEDCDLIRKKQIAAVKLLKEEEARVAAEDRQQFLKVYEAKRKEEEEAAKNKVLKRDQLAQELKEQLEIQKKIMAQRKLEEDALEEAFNKLAEIELQKERDKVKDTTLTAKKEMAMYKAEITRLQAERKEEEKKMDALLEEYRQQIQEQQDEARCKIEFAKRMLHESVLRDRAEQLRYKKEEMEQQLKMKETENELLRLTLETQKKLDEEAERRRQVAVQQYNEDLQKQVEYQNVLRVSVFF